MAPSRRMTGDCRIGDDVAASAPLIRIVKSSAPTAGAGNAGVRRALATGWARLGAVGTALPGPGGGLSRPAH